MHFLAIKKSTTSPVVLMHACRPKFCGVYTVQCVTRVRGNVARSRLNNWAETWEANDVGNVHVVGKKIYGNDSLLGSLHLLCPQRLRPAPFLEILEPPPDQERRVGSALWSLQYSQPASHILPGSKKSVKFSRSDPRV